MTESKIQVANPVVNIQGDEMARVMWDLILAKLIHPNLHLPLVDVDFGIMSREADPGIVLRAAELIKQHRVGIKCATITADEKRVREFGLSRMDPSPNGILRNALDGTIFRAPIVVQNVPRLVRAWEVPITVARHGFGDQYKAAQMKVPGAGTLQLTFVPEGGGDPVVLDVHKFTGPGVGMAMFNTDESIAAFARACFRMGLATKLPVYLGTKNTILKVYDGRFKDLFAQIFEEEFKATFEVAGISYQHFLIDDIVAWSLKSRGGFIWACKNYDGDVQSDMVAQGFGSLGLMTSVLINPDGTIMESEAAHGTVTRHFRRHQRGESTSTNPTASIFAWTRGLKFRGELDGNRDLVAFCAALEKACVDTIEGGKMTRDLALSIHGDAVTEEHYLTTEGFIDAVAETLASIS